MSKIIQVSCDNPVCYNMIELAETDDLDEIHFVLVDFGWTQIGFEDYCPDCSGDEETEYEES